MLEKAMRQTVVSGLRELDAVSVENLVGSGTPDVNIIPGWIELKKLVRWPRSGVVKVPHYTPEQRAWSFRRARAGGRTWMLLRIDSTEEWFLFDGPLAAINLGRVWAEQDCREHCLGYWKRSVNWDAMKVILTA